MLKQGFILIYTYYKYSSIYLTESLEAPSLQKYTDLYWHS